MRKKIDDFSFWDHLEDLRRKFLLVIAFFMCGFLGGYLFLSFRLIQALTSFAGRSFYYLSVFEPFFTRVKVSFFLSLLASTPLLLVQLIRFTLPGLQRREKLLLLVSAALFLSLAAGAGILLFRVSPLLLKLFLESFAAPGVEYRLSVSTLITFYIMLLAADIVLILIPTATFLLLKLGIISVRQISRARKILVPVFLLLAALITPPDPGSMLLIACPLWLLFEITLLVFRLLSRGFQGSENQSP
jgi:sec-independent protein translocase protein TatC